MAITSLGTSSSQNGLDVQAVVDQIMYAERAPERSWQQQQATLDAQSAALSDLQDKLDSLKSSLYGLTAATGAIAARTASSSNSNLLTASAGNNTTATSHTVVVRQLAAASSCYTKPLADAATTFDAGTGLTLKVGNGDETAITFDETHNTLGSAADYINSLSLGITATVVTDLNGARLALVSNQTGSAGTIQIADDTTGLFTTPPSPGQNALLTVDGVSMEAGANTISTAISGVTLQLNGVDPNTTVRVNVAPDSSAIVQSLSAFVGAYNDVIGAVNAQFSYSSATQSAGILSGDSALREVQSRLLADVGYAPAGAGGAIGSLSALGITMNNDGTLAVNGGKLLSAVQSHPAELQDFLQNDTAGFAVAMQKDLSALTDFVTGPIRLELTGNDAGKNALQRQIDDFEVRMADRQQALLAQYTNIDSMLRQLPILQQQISAQLASLSSD